MDGFPACLLADLRRELSTCWSERLFAGSVERTPSEPWLKAIFPVAFLATLAGLLFCSRLGCALLEPEEARYAEIPRQMLVEGRWLAPVLHGEVYYQKPPLLYWLIMVSYQIFGVHDWAARLVPCLAGMLVVLLAYGWARRAVGPRAALAGAIILTLSARFLYLGGMVATDSLLCLWVVGGLACAHLALAPPDCGWRVAERELECPPVIGNRRSRIRASWWLLSALCCGLGIMTKGPVAAVLILGPVVTWMLLERRCPSVAFGWWLGYGALVLVVAAPWYGVAAWRDPDATGTFFWLHNIVRFLTPFDHEKPAWFYLPSLVLGMLPWAFLLVPLIPYLLRRSPRWARRRPAGLGFFLLASGWCLAFFSLSGCKRAAYILPALPTLALALGTYLARGLPWNARFKTLWAVSVGVTALGLLVASHALLPHYHRHFGLRGQVRRHADMARRMAVACYPRRWDSLSFYLGREVACFGPREHDELLAQLRSEQTLLFVKNDGSLEEVLRTLPQALEFVECGRQGWNVRVGVVTPKVPCVD
jgi:4-amino-4-deoxy-L-arabinose transferase-like glycosyltransferase